MFSQTFSIGKINDKSGGARKRSAFGITMPWFIDSSRPTGDVGLSRRPRYLRPGHLVIRVLRFNRHRVHETKTFPPPPSNRFYDLSDSKNIRKILSSSNRSRILRFELKLSILEQVNTGKYVF